MYQRTFWGKTTHGSAAVPDLALRDWAPLLPLILLMVWLGSYTQSFMPPISSATARILDQTRMNDEYRVRVILPAAPHRAIQIERVFRAR
jgi:NADH-quinone oxidoreductase subunit M